MSYRQIAVLARAPHIGQVKTRLAQGMSDWSAYQFHRWSITEVLGRLCREVLGSSPLLFQTDPHPLFEQQRLEHPPRSQRGDHLGLKMFNALVEAFSIPKEQAPNDAVILLGTDSPMLPAIWLKEALDHLSLDDSPRVAIGPAEDGGYYTIGCNRAALLLIRPLFDNQIKWGSEEVFTKSLTIARSLVTEVMILPVGMDIDHFEDLERARQEMTANWDELDTFLSPSPLAPPDDKYERQRYQSALERLFSLTRFGERMDLSGPRTMNQALNDPLSSYRNILIGGTNGKGSTSAALSYLAERSALKVGVFTSPHLISFRERIRVGNVLISAEDVSRGVEVIFDAAERACITLSFFEATWALAAWYFRERELDWVIWEVGLGGRLDATNTCEPVCSAICSLSLDHTHVLGDTLEAIGREKAAIYRQGKLAFTGCSGDSLRALSRVSSVEPISNEAERRVLEESYRSYADGEQSYEIPQNAMVHTPHGRSNIALAWKIACGLSWSITESAMSSDLSIWRELSWAGRLEMIEGLWLDCAHNRGSADQIKAWLNVQRQREPNRSIHLIVGMSADKEIAEVLYRFISACDQITFVSPRYPRCLSADQLFELYQEGVEPLLQREGLDQGAPEIEIEPSVINAMRQRDARATTLVTGSCFLVGEARAWLLGIPFPELGVLTTAR